MLIGVVQLVTKVNTCKDQQQATERKNAEEQRQKEKKYLDKSALLKSKDEPPISNHWTLLPTAPGDPAKENCEKGLTLLRSWDVDALLEKIVTTSWDVVNSCAVLEKIVTRRVKSSAHSIDRSWSNWTPYKIVFNYIYRRIAQHSFSSTKIFGRIFNTFLFCHNTDMAF